MSKRLYLAAGFTFSLLAFSPPASHAQIAQRITVEWQNAPLSHVVRALSAFSGQTIVVAPDVGDPELTVSVQNVDWRRALDLALASRALVARADAAGVIHIEKRA
jgi:type II secretory pathway component HofQ